MRIKNPNSNNVANFDENDFMKEVPIYADVAMEAVSGANDGSRFNIKLFVSSDRRLLFRWYTRGFFCDYGKEVCVALFTDEDADEFLYRYRALLEIHLMFLPNASQERIKTDEEFDKVEKEKIEESVLERLEYPLSLSKLKKVISLVFGTNVERSVEKICSDFVAHGILKINDGLELELVKK